MASQLNAEYFFVQDHESTVREFLPDRKFDLMVTVLKKFFNFMNLTASVSTCIKGKNCRAISNKMK